jgi:hypothetical protein
VILQLFYNQQSCGLIQVDHQPQQAQQDQDNIDHQQVDRTEQVHDLLDAAQYNLEYSRLEDL